MVLGSPSGWVAGGAALGVLTFLWAVLPRVVDRVDDTPRNEAPSAKDEPDA